MAPTGATFIKAGAVVTATGAGKTVSLTLTAANSSEIATAHAGVWTFVVWATGAAAGSGKVLLTGTFPAKALPLAS